MRAIRCTSGLPTVVEVPEPEGDGVVVTVVSAGICGSDLHLAPLGMPATFGHEYAGVLPDGRPVAVEPLGPCGTCTTCVEGSYQLCLRGAVMYGITADGGMAERALVPASAIVPLPAGLDPRDACLVEPVAVAVHGVRRSGVRPGQQALVVGAGTIGLCAVVAARAAGALVDVVARHDHQREAAERLGASLEVRPGPVYDVVFESAGTSAALATAVAHCRSTGRVVLLGTPWDGLELPALDLAIREVSLVPSMAYGRSGASRDVDVAAAMLATQPEIAATLITHRFPLDAAAEAFRVAADRASGAIKVVLEP